MTHPAWIIAMITAAFAVLFLLGMLDESRNREREHLRAVEFETERDELLDVVAQLTEELHNTRVSRGVSDQQLARAVIAPADRSDPGECRNFRACTETRRLLDEANAKWIARQALVAPQESGL